MQILLKLHFWLLLLTTYCDMAISKDGLLPLFEPKLFTLILRCGNLDFDECRRNREQSISNYACFTLNTPKISIPITADTIIKNIG